MHVRNLSVGDSNRVLNSIANIMESEDETPKEKLENIESVLAEFDLRFVPAYLRLVK